MRRFFASLVAVFTATAVLLATAPPAAARDSLTAYAKQHGAAVTADLLMESSDLGTQVIADRSRSGAALGAVTTSTGTLDPVLQTQLATANQGRATPTAAGRIVPTNVRPRIKGPGKLGMILDSGAMLLGLGGLLTTPDDAVEYVGPAFDFGPQSPPGWDGTRGMLVPIGSPTRDLSVVWSTDPTGVYGASTNPDAAATLGIAWSLPASTTQGTWTFAIRGQSLCRVEAGEVTYNGTTYTTGQSFWQLGNGPGAGLGAPAASNTATLGAACITGFSNPSTSLQAFRVAVYSVSNPTLSSTPIATRTFYYEGNPDRPEQSPELVDVTTTVECVDANGAVTALTSTEALDLAPGSEWVPPSVECPAGQVAQSARVDGTAGGTTRELLPRTDAPPWVTALPSFGPEATTGLDVLTLEVLDPATQAWLSCVARPDLCLDWETKTDTVKADNYRCRLGSATVQLGACTAMRFDPQDPQNPGYRVPAPLSPDSPLRDPATGDAPAPSNNCPPAVSFTSFITGQLVYQAVTCALSWAFVPNMDRVAWQDTRDTITTRGPGPALGVVGTVVSALSTWDDGVSDCRGPVVEWSSWLYDFEVYFFDACDEPHSTVAGMARLWLGISAWVTAAYTSANVLASSLNMRLPFSGGDVS